MKKENKLSKAEMKNVKGGGLPPTTPGGDPRYCGTKGYVVCLGEGAMGPVQSYFYACCTSLADAAAFCPAGHTHTCVFPFIES